MIIPGSNPPTTKEYPQVMYWVDIHTLEVTRETLVRNCGWHSMIHRAESGKSVRDERLFSNANDAIAYASDILAQQALELEQVAGNFSRSVSALLARGDKP